MIMYTNPKATRRIKNYTVLSLNGKDEDVRLRWLKSMHHLRSWCFNSTNNRYKFGKESHKCAMIPEKGHFFLYLEYNGKWLCLVIEGSTLYLVGFVTSSIGPNLRVQQMDNGKVRHIEGSIKMKWTGNYFRAEKSNVGAEPLRSAFHVMYRHTARQQPMPSDVEVRKWCDVFVTHFPEAARFDSMLLCNINRRFSESGKVGKKAITKARQWSKDCQSVLDQMTLTEGEISESKSEKGKSKKGRISKRKTIISEVSGKTNKKCKDMTDEQIQHHIEDVRLFHRSKPCHSIVTLCSLPIQLRDGEAVGIEDLKDEDEDLEAEMNFLIQPVNGISHESCGYVDSVWNCIQYLSDSEKPIAEVKGLGFDTNQSEVKTLGFDTNQLDLEAKKRHNAGLYNLGNTCYANSTLQCMYSIAELKSALQSYPCTARVDNVDQDSHNLTLATHETFVALDQSDRPVSPLQFLKTLRKKYPIFASQIDGVYMQQDAEECWTLLMNTLSETLVAGGPTLSIKELFGIGLVSRDGMDAESLYSLKCVMSQDVNHIQEGIEHGLKIHGTETKIDELPKYLTVQFDRVTWEGEKGTAKILRKVDYPLELDVYELCADALKQKLKGLRQGSSSSVWESTSMDIDKGESSIMDIDKGESYDMDIDNDAARPSTKLTGMYDLIAVLSHHGPTANSGHYVGWVKQDGMWIQFDDDKQSIHQAKDILKLSGGGEGHMAYICLFKGHLAQ